MIRTITLLACLLLARIAVNAQLAPADSLRIDLDKIFQNVNKSQVPTGLLEEYGAALVPLDVFNGALTDSNSVSPLTWRGIYSSLYTARIYGTNTMPLPGTVNSTIQTELLSSGNAIPVAMLHYDYAAVRPDAVSAGLFTVQNNQLYDVPNRTQSPYSQRNCFAVTPMKAWSEGQPSLIFKSNLFFTNSTKSITSIQVNFDDGGGLKTATMGVAIAANYTTEGKHRITIRVTFNDNSVRQCYTELEVSNLSVASRYPRFEDDIISIASTTAHSGATLYVTYSQTNNTHTLKRPFIVVEGYDISSIAPNLQSNYSYRHFIDGINRPGFDHLNDNLDLAGYDIVFVDFRNGTDDIRRNAALVADVITRVNTMKSAAGSTEKNVVMGISMGALVARYALASMTKNAQNPQTRLLISHDGPHRGANLPIGIQSMITQLYSQQFLPMGMKMTELVPQLLEAKAVAEAPATQQLLLVRPTGTGLGITTNTFLDDAYRTMVTFPATGPQPAYRMIATSQGSQCGKPVLQEQTKLVDMRGKFRVSILIFRTNYYLDLESWALSSNTSAPVTHIKFSTNKTLLFIPIRRTLYEATMSINATAAGIKAWDVVPGGTQSTLAQVGTVPGSIPDSYFKVLGFIRGKVTSEINIAPGREFTFIPTVSALDIADVNSNSLYGKYTSGISPYNSRMNTFIAQESFTSGGLSLYNEEHTNFTARNSDWIFNEVQGLPNNLQCTSECGTDFSGIISGPENACPSGTYQFSGNMLPGSTVVWSADPIGVVQLSPNGNSVTATKIPGASGQFFNLRASFASTCSNNVIFQKTVSAGGPQAPVLTSSRESQTQFIIVANNMNGLGYDWFVNDVQIRWNADAVTYRDVPCGQRIYVKARQTNTCGTSVFSEPLMIWNTCARIGQFMVNPNPANTQVVVRFTDQKKSLKTMSDAQSARKIRIFDILGRLRKEDRIPAGDNQKTIDVSDLPVGVYIMEIGDGKNAVREKIFINRAPGNSY